MQSEFENRRNYVLNRLDEINGLSYQKPAGAFYVFPNISSYFGTEFNGTCIRNSYDFTYYLLEKENVVLVPGTAFGSNDHVRISYATSMQNLEKGIDRINKALMKL